MYRFRRCKSFREFYIIDDFVDVSAYVRVSLSFIDSVDVRVSGSFPDFVVNVRVLGSLYIS